MLPSERSSDRLLALVLGGVLALNYPLMSLFSDVHLLFGIPILYLYLFAVWSAFILLPALLMERKPEKNQDSENHQHKPHD